MTKRYGMLINLDWCIGCYSCVVACKQHNDLRPRVDERPGTRVAGWAQVRQVGPSGTFPDIEMHYVPRSCMHCDNPACEQVCPTGATFKRKEDGIVLVDRDKCIGCQYCTLACPYDVRVYEEASGVVTKCTMCADRIAEGLKPFCVTQCVAQARIFGDVNDPSSEISRAIASGGSHVYQLLPEMGTKPNIYYLTKKHTWRG